MFKSALRADVCEIWILLCNDYDSIMDPKLSYKADVKSSDDKMTKKYIEKFDKLLLSDSDEEFSDIACEICLKTFPTVQLFKEHLNSSKHYKMLYKLKSMQKLGLDVPKRKSIEDRLHSDSNEELYCDVCDKEMSGYSNYMAHINGSVHAKNLRQLKLREKDKGMKEFLEGNLLDGDEEDDTLPKPYAHCSTCCKKFSGPESYHQHMQGVNHKKKLRNLKLLESLDTGNGVEDDESYSKCDVCNKAFSGLVPYKIHLRSSVHKKELQRVETEKELKDYFEKNADGTKLVCKECKKVFSDPFSFKSHLANNSHGKQKVKDQMFRFVTSYPEITVAKTVQNLSSGEGTGNFQKGHYSLRCKLCHVYFSSPESAQDHLESKKHLQAINEKAERKILNEKLRDKPNGCPDIDPKASEIVKNTQKDLSTNGE